MLSDLAGATRGPRSGNSAQAMRPYHDGVMPRSVAHGDGAIGRHGSMPCARGRPDPGVPRHPSPNDWERGQGVRAALVPDRIVTISTQMEVHGPDPRSRRTSRRTLATGKWRWLGHDARWARDRAPGTVQVGLRR